MPVQEIMAWGVLRDVRSSFWLLSGKALHPSQDEPGEGPLLTTLP